MLRRTLAVVVALAGSATLAAPASAVLVNGSTPATVLAPGYGPGYSPAVTQQDSYYPNHGDPGIDVLGYDLNLRWYPKTPKLRGVATLRIRAVQDAPQFQLDLAKRLAVSSVRVGDLDAPYTHDGQDLVVTDPVQAGKTYDVTVTYAGAPHQVKAPTSRVDVRGLGWHTTKDGQVWTIQEPYGAYTWYPVNDMPADKAMYTVRLDVPDKWIGISNGTMTTRKHLGHRLVTTFTNKHPMASYLTTVAIGNYRKITQTGPHGLPMTYWYPKGRRDLLTPLRTLPKAMTWLEHRLGSYPFERVGVVLTPGDAAMETQTMVTLGLGNYRYGNRDVRETLVHELVHSWYGDSVTPTDWSDLWMNEGMAMFLESKYSVHMGWKPWKHWRREFNRNDHYWRDIYGPPGAYDKHQFAQRNVYYCTARMLNRLHNILGAKAFYSAVKAWPQRFRDQGKDRAGYVRWLQRRTGKKLGDFFATELDDPRPTL